MKSTLKSEKKFVSSLLTLNILAFMPQAYALQAMSDNDLRAVDGQDGLTTEVDYTQVKIDQVGWIDKAGKPVGEGEEELRATWSNIEIGRGALPKNQKLGVVSTLDVYSSPSQFDTTAGLNLNVKATLGKISSESIQICKASGCSSADASMGGLQIESYQPIEFNLLTTNGLFNKDAKAYLDLSMKNVSIGISQQDGMAKSNILKMKDFNINLRTLSYMYIDAKDGFSLISGQDGYADFIRDEITAKPGINLEFTINDQGLLRAGANGRMVNGLVQFGAGNLSSDLLGMANSKSNNSVFNSNNSIAGSTGGRFKIAGEFTNDSDKLGDRATTLELGGAGNFSYGFRFENITALRTRSNITGTERGDIALTTERAGLNMGGVYLNLVDSHQITLPENKSLTSTYLGTTSGSKAVQMANSSDYIQTIANTGSINPNSAVLSLREVEFVSLSRRGRFIASPDVTDPTKLPAATASQWGLGLPIYNLNSNLAFYGKTSDGINDFIAKKNQNGIPTLTPVSGSERIGFSASISTEGVSKDGSKSTSILLIDGANNNNYANGMVTPTDYYIGLRNIDMLLNGYGSIGFEQGQVNVSMPNLKMIVAAQFAAGYLPGAKYQSCPVTGGCYAPSNNFTTPYDVLAGFKLRLDGGINFALVPRAILTDQVGLVDGVNALNIIGLMTLNSSNKMNNAFQVVDSDGSSLGLDNLSGSIAFDNNIAINKDNVGFNYSFIFNPNKKPGEVFRVGDLNLYPATTLGGGPTTVGDPQRLGEFAITGGRINLGLTLTPRDTPFVF